MMNFLFWLIITVATIQGCGVTQHPIDWPKVAQCGPGINDIIGVVERVLLSDGTDAKTLSERAKAELEQLARDHGADTVACVLNQVIHDWTSPGAAQNDLRFAALQRGQAFAQEIGTRVEVQQ